MIKRYKKAIIVGGIALAALIFFIIFAVSYNNARPDKINYWVANTDIVEGTIALPSDFTLTEFFVNNELLNTYRNAVVADIFPSGRTACEYIPYGKILSFADTSISCQIESGMLTRVVAWSGISNIAKGSIRVYSGLHIKITIGPSSTPGGNSFSSNTIGDFVACAKINEDLNSVIVAEADALLLQSYLINRVSLDVQIQTGTNDGSNPDGCPIGGLPNPNQCANNLGEVPPCIKANILSLGN